MNMTLSKRGDYVVRSALALARAHGEGQGRKIREVVAEMAVPQTYASQILADLVRAGLATSKAGRDGGYRLARRPEDTTLLEVVEAGEGPLHAERCALGDGPCRWEAVCPLHETWRAATAALREVLARTTLADLVAQDLLLQDGQVSAPADSHRLRAASVAVSDRVQVEVGAAEVAAALCREEVVVAAATAAGAEADALRERLDPAGPPWAPVQVAAAVRSRPGADAPGYELALELSAAGGAAVHVDGVLTVRELDPRRSQVRARLRVRPPGAGLAEAFAAPAELARAFVRALLLSLAQAAEAAPAVVRAGSVSRGR